MTKRKDRDFEKLQESEKKVKHDSQNTVISTQNSGEEIVDTDESMLSRSPESDSDSIDYSSALGTPEQNIIEENSDNFENQGDISTRPKHFTTNMFKDDIEKFNQARKEGAEVEKQFIQDYINEHGNDNVSSEDDVYSLLLHAAVVLRDIELIKYILDINHKDNILTNIDYTNSSSIFSVLVSRDKQILELIDQYIKENGENIKKTDLDGRDRKDIFSLTCSPMFKNTDPVDWYNHLLIYLYSEETLKDLADLIGVNDVTENFDSGNWWN